MRIRPQARLFLNVLFMTVSKRPPEIDIPVPSGAEPDAPTCGTFASLLSWMLLFMNTQQECVWVIGLVPPFSHEPSCGGGLSPFWLLVSNPSSLLSNSEFLTTSWPPEFDPG